MTAIGEVASPPGTVTIPRLRGSVRCWTVEPDQVFLLSETHHYVLIGRAYRCVAPLVDGVRSSAEIVAHAARHCGYPQALFALQEMTRKGYVVDAGPGGVDDATWAWADLLGTTPAVASARVVSARVGVEWVGPGASAAVADALQARGLTVVAAEDAPTHRVVLADDLRRAALAASDAAARRAGLPWLLAKPRGAVPWIGPGVVPGETACWQCLAAWLDGTRQVERYVERHGAADVPVVTARAAGGATRHAAELLATAVEAWVIRGALPEALRGALVTYDLVAGTAERHVVIRRPQCAGCGEPAAAARAVRIGSARKVFTGDGGHRTAHPEQTWARVAPWVSPVTGLVSSLVRKEERDDGLRYSYAAGHAFVQPERDVAALKANLRFRSGGKGMTEVQSRVSAVGESVERWSGVWRGDEPREHGAARDLGDRVVPLESVLLFSAAQYAGRAAWNRACSPTGYHLVPHPLDPALPIDWTAATSLTRGGTRLLPAASCWYGHPDAAHFFCATDANGTSAGNTLEEAILQGFLELAERDAVAMWWYLRIPRPAVDLDAWRDPYLDRLRERYDAMHRDLWVLDLTNDLGIPVFAGVSRRRDGPPEDIIASFGAHRDARIALTRAVTETSQFLPALSRREPDGSTRYAYDDPDAIAWWSREVVAAHPWLAPAAGRPASTPTTYAHLTYHDDLRDDIHACVETARAAGVETLVIDQTRPDAPLAVARVVAPGLRHFWRRLAPGRLYDVPVRLGWVPTAPDERDLNPVSLFF